MITAELFELLWLLKGQQEVKLSILEKWAHQLQCFYQISMAWTVTTDSPPRIIHAKCLKIQLLVMHLHWCLSLTKKNSKAKTNS